MPTKVPPSRLDSTKDFSSLVPSAFAQANAAFAQANTGGGGSSTDSYARSTANAAFSTANSALTGSSSSGFNPFLLSGM